MPRYRINVCVTRAVGTQSWLVDADSPEQALEAFAEHGGDESEWPDDLRVREMP